MNTTLLTGASGYLAGELLRVWPGDRPVIRLSRQQPIADQLAGQTIECLIHLAAVTGGASEEDALAVNVAGTRRLIRELLDRGCRKFVLASSIAATGCLDARFRPRQLPIPDDHPCLAYDAYGLSKALMEETARYFARIEPAADITCLRIGAVRERWDLHAMPAGAPADGLFLMGAQVSVRDVVAGMLAVVNAPPRPGFHLYNLVGPDASCVEPVPALLRRGGLGYEWPGGDHDPIFDMRRFAEELGFRPAVSTRKD